MVDFVRRAKAHKYGGGRGAMIAGLGLATLALGAGGAVAEQQYTFGDLVVTINGTISEGAAIRTTAQNPELLTKANGAVVGITNASAVKGQNQADGDLNYKQGQIVSAPTQGDVFINAQYGNAGVKISAKAWYDYTLENQGVGFGNEANGYTSGGALSDKGFANQAQFKGISLMDAYLYDTFELGSTKLEVRAGNQIINWGINTQIAGGLLTSINGIDLNSYFRPGVQPEEILNRAPAIYAKFDLTDKIGIEGFYRFLPSVNTPLGCGTFFSSADYIQQGCNYVLAGGPGTDAQQIAAGYTYDRVSSPTYSDPQFGVGGTFKADILNTKFGLYYAHVDDTVIVPGAITTLRSLAAPFVPSTVASVVALNPKYFTANPPNVNVITTNFQTQLNNTRIYGEATIKPGDPTAYNASDMLAAFASGTAASQLRGAATALGAHGLAFDGYDRLDQGQFDLGIMQTFPNILGAQELVVGGEAALKEVFDLPNVDVARFGRSDVYGIGPVNGVCPAAAAGETAAMRALQCSNNGYVSQTAWGYRLNAILKYRDVLTPGLNITPAIGLSQDVSGWSADTLFNQGRLILNLAVNVDYQQRYFAGATWNPELIQAAYDQNSDRQVFMIYGGMKF